MRRSKIERPRSQAVIEGILHFIQGIIRQIFFGGQRPAGEGHGPTVRQEEEDLRWIKHEFWEPEFYMELILTVILFPFFIRDVIATRQAKARNRRQLVKQARIHRYRARVAMMSKTRRTR